jgi:CBS domain-containing protein
VKGLKAKDIMTQNVLTAKADWSMERLAEFFSANSISGAPVISEDEKLIGVVSLTDIVLRNTLPEEETRWNETHEYYVRALEHHYSRGEISSFCIGSEPLVTVRDIMTPTIFSVDEDATVQQVADTMLKERIHRVFVTRGGSVVGIIATPDMLKVIRDG